LPTHLICAGHKILRWSRWSARIFPHIFRFIWLYRRAYRSGVTYRSSSISCVIRNPDGKVTLFCRQFRVLWCTFQPEKYCYFLAGFRIRRWIPAHPAYNSMMQKESHQRLSFCLELIPMLELECSGEDTVESDRTVSLPVVYSLALPIHLLG